MPRNLGKWWAWRGPLGLRVVQMIRARDGARDVVPDVAETADAFASSPQRPSGSWGELGPLSERHSGRCEKKDIVSMPRLIVAG